MDIEAEINDLVATTITNIEHSVGNEMPYNWFRIRIEEPPSGAAPTAADVRLSYSKEVTRTHFGTVTSSRNWLEARITLEGVPLMVSFPFRTGDDGMPCGDRYCVPTCKATLLEWFALHRPNKKFPLDVDKPALQFKRAEISTRRSRDVDAEWTKPARVVAACNEWLTRFGYTPLDTTQGNALLAAIDELLTTNRAVCAWVTDDISVIYNRHGKGDVPYTSCMSGGDTEWFALYDYLQGRGLLSMVEITRDGVHVGRALVWHGSNPDDLYMDRIYAAPYRDSFEPDVIRILKEFCAEHNIRKCVYSQTAERLGLEFVGGFSIATGADPSDFSHYPYLDSLRYFCYDGRLRMSSGHGGLELNETDGGPNQDDFIELENGDRVPEDDARHCGYLGEWHHVNYVTYSDFHDDYIPDNEVLVLHNGWITYKDNDDVVELYDGQFAIYEDATELYNGTWALDEDVVELLDGTYARHDDSDVVELHDGSYTLLNEEVVELHDGTLALHEDAVELPDGTYALRDGTIEWEDGSYTLRAKPEPTEPTEPEPTEPEPPRPARTMPADLPPLPEGYDYVGVGPLFPPRDDGHPVREQPPDYLAACVYSGGPRVWSTWGCLTGNSPHLHYAALRGTEVHRQLLG